MNKGYIQDQEFNGENFSEQGLDNEEYDSCTFSNCNFLNADLSETTFTSCTFADCDLSMAALRGTSFQDVRFTRCKLLGLRFDECNGFSLSFSFDQCLLDFASFFRLKLKDTHFNCCRMGEVELVETDLTNAVFQECDLERAVFDRTILEGADLRTAFNFSIDPEANRLRNARFSAQNVAGLLNKYHIIIE